MVYKYFEEALSWLLPDHCALCDSRCTEGLPLCGGCLGDLPANDNACIQCALPLAVGGPRRCGQCQRQPPAFRHVVAPFRYGPPLDYLIQDFKFRRRMHQARLLGGLLVDAIACEQPLPDCIVPVPLHPRRLRERSFNQSAELARIIARQLGLPVHYRACRRVRATKAQSGLPAKKRPANIRNAFAICRRYDGQGVAVIDDVMTTGHTANEVARCLLRAGARHVDIWVIARAG